MQIGATPQICALTKGMTNSNSPYIRVSLISMSSTYFAPYQPTYQICPAHYVGHICFRLSVRPSVHASIRQKPCMLGF